MDTAKSDHPKASTFATGELIYPEGLEATFRVKTVGEHGMTISRVSKKVIVPKEPYLVTFKGVLFKVVGWSGRNFTIHTVKQAT